MIISCARLTLRRQEYLHHWLGRGIVLLGCVNVFLGIAELQTKLLFGNWVFGILTAWYGLLLLVLLVLVFVYRGVFFKSHQAKKTRGDDSHKYASSQPVSEGKKDSAAIETGVIAL